MSDEDIIERHYFNGQLLSESSMKTTSYVVSVLKKHIEALKEAISTWNQRKKKEKKKGHAQWHLDYLESQLQREIETLDNIT